MSDNNWWVIWDFAGNEAFAIRSDKPLRENENIELLSSENDLDDDEEEDAIFIYAGDWQVLAHGLDEAAAMTLLLGDKTSIQQAVYMDFAGVE